MRKAAYIYEDALSQHVLREGHPFVPSRLRCTYELLEAYGAFEAENSLLAKPRHATDEEALTFHTADYVAAVKGFSKGSALAEPARYNFNAHGDNPTYPGMFEAATLVSGGSLVAADLLLEEAADVAFNSSGGLHHAAPGHASGFCVFNDAAIAIKHLVSNGLRVAYVDIDVHHGDGVQNAFYDTDAILTISIHESGAYLFPGTGGADEIGSGKGKGFAVNLPLAPYTDDEVYLWAFGEIVPPLVSRFRPDVLVTQLGIDTHFSDPLAHVHLTSQGYIQAIRELGSLCSRWLALGGGGYDIGAVARCWTLAYGVMLERDWPDAIPEEHRERYGLAALRDQEGPSVDAKVRESVWAMARKSVDELKRSLFPLHGL
ncbi:MAG: acetoin utilization protein AcuC [Dehalococcoidia bacterium]